MKRPRVVGFAVTLAVITYIDRVCIMKTAGAIRAELGLTDAQLGWALGIFAWTYGLFEVPWGALGDRIGARRILTRVVVCWSVFTAATGWVWSFPSLLATRALFGAGEAGCFPNLTKTFTTWLSEKERARAQGVLWLAARWAGAFTPLLVVLVLRWVSWRGAFVLFATLGLVWAFFFNRGYRDGDPARPEPALPPVPWRAILGSGRVWLLCLQYFCLSYSAYFYISWLPTYLERVRGVTGPLAAVMDGMPLFFMGTGSLFCGFFLARLTRWTGDVARARRVSAVTGFVGAAAFLFLSTRIPGAVPAMLVMGLAGFANDLVMPASWAASMDLGGRYAATVSALMNMVGCAGAGAFPIVTAKILERSGQNWNAVLAVSALVYFAGALCWIVLDSVTPIAMAKEADT